MVQPARRLMRSRIPPGGAPHGRILPGYKRQPAMFAVLSNGAERWSRRAIPLLRWPQSSTGSPSRCQRNLPGRLERTAPSRGSVDREALAVVAPDELVGIRIVLGLHGNGIPLDRRARLESHGSQE